MIILGVVASQQAEITGIPEPDSVAWRILITGNQVLAPETNISIGRVRWLDENGDVISLTGATHTANSYIGGHLPNHAFDTNEETYWTGMRDTGVIYGVNAWLQTTWGTSKEVRGIIIEAAADDAGIDDAPREFAIQYRTPGGSWITLFSVIGQITWDPNESRIYRLGGRVWKVVVNTTTEGTTTTVSEIEFRESVDVSEPAEGGFIIASSEVLPDRHNYAADGSAGTVWSTDSLPASVEYWFPTTKIVNQIAIFGSTGREDEAPLTVQVYYSDDFGVTFTEVGDMNVVIDTGGYGFDYGNNYGGE